MPPYMPTRSRVARPSVGREVEQFGSQKSRGFVVAEVLVRLEQEVEHLVVERDDEHHADGDGQRRPDDADAQLTEVLGERHRVAGRWICLTVVGRHVDDSDRRGGNGAGVGGGGAWRRWRRRRRRRAAAVGGGGGGGGRRRSARRWCGGGGDDDGGGAGGGAVGDDGRAAAAALRTRASAGRWRRERLVSPFVAGGASATGDASSITRVCSRRCSASASAMILFGSAASRTMFAVSRISRIGSSSAYFSSDWKPVLIFFSSA